MAAVSSGMNSNAPPIEKLDVVVEQAYARVLAIAGKSLSDSQLRELQAVFAGLKAEAEDVEELVTAKDVMIANAVQANQQLTARVTQIGALHLTLTTNYASLEARSLKQQQDFDALQQANQTASDNYTDLKNQTATLKAEALALQQQYSLLETQFDVLTQTHATLTSQAQDLETKNASLADEFTALQKTSDESTQDAIALRQQCTDLETTYAQLKGETNDWTVRYDALNAEYAKLQGIVDDALKNQQVAKPYNPTDELLSKLWNTSWTLIAYQLPLTAQIPFHAVFAFGRYLLRQR